MALPTSGSLSIKGAAGAGRSICAEVGGSSGSLSTLSVQAGKSAPHCMREFYGYSASSPLSLTTLVCDEQTSCMTRCSRVDGMSTTNDCARLCVCYCVGGDSAKGSASSTCLVCNGTTVQSCIIIGTGGDANGTWSVVMNYDDTVCFVTRTTCGFASSGSWVACARLYAVTDIVGSYSVGTPNTIISSTP